MLLIAGLQCFAQPVEVKTYYDDAQTILKEIFYIDNPSTARLTGPYRSYYINGTLEKEGFYKNNYPDSLWHYYYEGGALKMKGMLKNGTNHGLWEYYYENGNLRMAGMIINSKREGTWKFYFENGQLKSQGDYKNGRRTGIWNFFYEDGKLKAQTFYDKNGRGRYKEFYNSGELKAEGININGKSDSTWVFYHENGKLKAVGDYQEGKRDGLWIFYHNNGKKSAEGSYVAGSKDGKWIYYHTNGEVSSEGALREGKKEGYWKFFGEDGKFKAEGIFEKDDGKYTEYYESGKIKAEGNIVDGKKDGVWIYYYEDGSKEGECHYLQDKGEYTGYYPDGTLKMKGKIEDGVNVGLWELYDGEGNLAGYYRPYYEDNKPIYKLVEKPPVRRGDYVKPAYKYKSYKSRYFDAVINEYKGIILSTGPLAPLFNQLPFTVEYYIQERLGYELQLGLLRKPFFKSSKNVTPGQIYNRGFYVSLRQKFYNPEGSFGMFYFGHEVRITPIRHFANVVDSTAISPGETFQINSSETRFEYAFFIGDRWMQLFGERHNNKSRGFTIDAYIGVGFGYRLSEKKYPANPQYDEIFKDLNDSKFVISPRLGLNIGFVF